MADPTFPPADALEPLTLFERAAVRIAAAQNRGAAKRLWTRVGRQTGARIVNGTVRSARRIDGWEHIEGADHTRPLLILANHRTTFDFFVISALLYEAAPWMTAMHFPVRSRHCYESLGGVAVNQFGACWSAFPPFWRRADTAASDNWALDLLAHWCKDGGPGRVIGFHPEGTRYRDAPDPWALLPAQPGIGKLIHTAQPQAIPVFITGLKPTMAAQWRDVRAGTASVRLRFGAPIDFSSFVAAPARARTYVEIGRHVMATIAGLAAEDRALIESGYGESLPRVQPLGVRA
jgi:1-acyl-sn-glycerol-3-phosphate acyltransferase